VVARTIRSINHSRKGEKEARPRTYLVGGHLEGEVWSRRRSSRAKLFASVREILAALVLFRCTTTKPSLRARTPPKHYTPTMAAISDRRRINAPSNGTSAPVFARTVQEPGYLQSLRPSRTRGPKELRKTCKWSQQSWKSAPATRHVPTEAKHVPGFGHLMNHR
jgi:hypothetical protein